MMKLTIFLTCLLTAGLMQGEVFVVTHHSHKGDSISKKELRLIFLGEKTRWEDGSRIKIAESLNKKTASRFYGTYVGKEVSRIKKIWIKKMLRGEMSPPESFKDQQELVEFIAGQKYCIGFVEGKKDLKGVKILKVKD
ncbi:MAG: hypothetical protein GY765_15805 [bacterium]|nr:hypothetical protein [bacterium]